MVSEMSRPYVPRWLVMMLALAAVLTWMPMAAEASGQAPAYRAPERTQDIHNHDRGFFFRFQIGPGYLSTHGDEFDVSMDGVGLDLGLAFGGIVRPNLAIHASLQTVQVVSPTLRVGGDSVVAEDFTLQLSMLGVGGTFYLADNYYVSSSVGLAVLTFDDNSGTVEASSERGFAQDISAGKEWWLAPRFGLGVAIGGGWHVVPDGNDSFTGYTIGLRLSGTVN